MVYADVSIPKRVLGWLELVALPDPSVMPDVSIPKRVLGWLELAPMAGLRRINPFQSLRGFWVGWNGL